jgi:hypothetical protein
MARVALTFCYLIGLVLAAGCNGDDPAKDGAVSDSAIPDVWTPKLDQEIPHEGGFPEGGLDGGIADQSGADDSGGLQVQLAPIFLDFEKNNGKLAGTRDWEWGKLAFKSGTNCGTSTPDPPTSGKSGTHVWGTVLNDCYSPLDNATTSCTNSSTTDDSVLTLKVKIPSSFTKATLTYWEWKDFFLTFDWSEVRIDGKMVKQTCTGTNPTPATWEQKSLDLSSYVGQTITVAFHFMASQVVNQSGWYLDDIAIKEF